MEHTRNTVGAARPHPCKNRCDGHTVGIPWNRQAAWPAVAWKLPIINNSRYDGMVGSPNPAGRCPQCMGGSTTTDTESGETFCSKCGLMLVERAESYGPERHSRDNSGKGSNVRTGPPTSPMMYDGGLSTVIGGTNRDASGRILTASMKSKIKRLRTQDDRSPADKRAARTLKHGLTKINRLKDKLSVSDAVMERAAYLFRKAMKMDMVRGRSIDKIVASIMYAACRESGTIRDLNDMERASNVKRKDIAKTYRHMIFEMGLTIPVTDPVRCVPKIASRLGLPETTSRRAIAMLNRAKNSGDLSGRSPTGLAAAALYMSCMENHDGKTQRELAMASDISMVSIRNVVLFLRSLPCMASE